MGAVLGEAVSVVCAQRTRQRVRRVGCAQQVTMTLNRIFAFQHGNDDRTGSHELNQTVKERATFVLSIEAASLLNGQMQHFSANDFEPCSFKARKDAANNVFCHRVWFDDGKSTFNSHDNLFIYVVLFCR